MEIKYVCPLLTVKDLEKSRSFYEDVLKQVVELDHGANLSFKGGFALHDEKHYQNLIRPIPLRGPVKKNFMELYFECDDLESLVVKLEEINVDLVHPLQEQPWGQRVIRFYDPDGYIIEVGEPMEVVIKRFAVKGLSLEEIVEKSSMPRDIVEFILKN